MKSAGLDDRMVRMVRDLRATGVPEAKVAAFAGVHAATVRQIVDGRTWRGLPPGDASRGAFMLLMMPKLLTAREMLLVEAALALTNGGEDLARLYQGFPRSMPLPDEPGNPSRAQMNPVQQGGQMVRKWTRIIESGIRSDAGVGPTSYPGIREAVVMIRELDADGHLLFDGLSFVDWPSSRELWKGRAPTTLFFETDEATARQKAADIQPPLDTQAGGPP